VFDTYCLSQPARELHFAAKSSLLRPQSERPVSGSSATSQLGNGAGAHNPFDHLQVICNGDVVRDLKINGDRETADVEDTIPLSRSGWCLLRAWSEKAEHPILDMYPYATTSPIYVTVAGSHPKPAEDAAYFIAWIDRMIDAAKSNQDWNTEAEKAAVLETLTSARRVYLEMEK